MRYRSRPAKAGDVYIAREETSCTKSCLENITRYTCHPSLSENRERYNDPIRQKAAVYNDGTEDRSRHYLLSPLLDGLRFSSSQNRGSNLSRARYIGERSE